MYLFFFDYRFEHLASLKDLYEIFEFFTSTKKYKYDSPGYY